MYRIKVIIDVAPEKLIAKMEKGDDLTSWNTTVTKHEVLKEFDSSNARISYQVTTEAGPGGIVSARDFIFLYKYEKRGNEWMQGGVSVEYPGPKSSKIVRAWNNPGGQFIRPVDGDPNKVWNHSVFLKISMLISNHSSANSFGWWIVNSGAGCLDPF